MISSAGQNMWKEPLFQETLLAVLAFLFLVSVVLFFLRKRSVKFMASWASLKSWLFISPILFFFVGLPWPWPLIFLALVSLSGAKTFYQMVGMYHRSWFVWVTYLSIIALGLIIYYNQRVGDFYNIMPMVFFGLSAFIPILRNSASRMIQYLALSLMCFIGFGWAFLHLGRLLVLDKGLYMMIYIYILAEFAENVSIATTRLWGRHKLFDQITKWVSVEGIVVSTILTVVLAWGLRHLLLDRSQSYWLAAGLIAALFGRVGHLLLSVIRRDLGIRSTGVFIIGRDDILARMDTLLFVAPLFYYVIVFLQHYGQI